MRLTIKSFVWLLFLVSSYTNAQFDQYNYKRELNGVSNQWHKLTLADEIFGKVSPNLSDIRIFGITTKNDTIEAPYLLHVINEKTISNNIDFKIINTSHNRKGYYFTFEIPSDESINQIELDFKQKNYDWKLNLEGSQNQKEWFTVIEDYRILSINNELTDYQFSKLSFSNSKYRFFRLLIGSKEKPNLNHAKISQYEVSNGAFRIYSDKKVKISEDKQAKQTEIDIDLQLPVFVSHIKIGVKDNFDFYRPITIKYLSDSIKTEQGWKYNYDKLTSGTLSSIEGNEFKFNNIIAQKLKILIHNKDDQPLIIDEIDVKGNIHELFTRFTEPATYFLAYGNRNAGSPKYDINKFTDKIPKNLNELKLGDEQIIKKGTSSVTIPLFKNKAWLWFIMTFIILLLGWFSLKMIKKNNY
ncbi:MAG: DUF3999 domain-containing protein [Bacteroidota bacterium]